MRRGFWTGLGLGLLLAGIIGVFVNVSGRVAGNVERAAAGRVAEQADAAGSADRAEAGTSARYDGYGYGWRGHHHFWGFPFLLLSCLFPFVFIAVVAGIVRRMFWQRHWHGGWGGHPGWGHHRRGEPGEPVSYV